MPHPFDYMLYTGLVFLALAFLDFLALLIRHLIRSRRPILMNLPEVARLLVTELKPNDIIVVECNRKITFEQGEQIRAHLQAAVGERPILVMAPDLPLSVMSPEDEQ